MNSKPCTYLAIVLLLAAGCANIAVPLRPAAANLPQDYARFRAAQVSNVDYRLHLRINEASAEYEGTVRIEFDLDGARHPVTVDFAEGTIRSLAVNGREIEPDYNGWYLTLPATSLTIGRQQVDIGFARAYSTDSAGFYRYVDPEDNRVYVYTDFEPYHANRLFPNFDQPDVKSGYQLTVDVPADWIVVSAEPEASVSATGDGTRRWTFWESERFSTYIFSLHAGPWRVWSDNAGQVPLRLLARQSLARHVDAEFWLKVTRQGFEFFEDYFAIPYPFDKYDQVIVPDFSGAMENVGAVTFAERYVKRGVATRLEREALANVLLHELAHMWFGNLVTMRWWNGLWLNESFATFMANLSEEANTEFREAWLTYFVNRKQSAYEADEQPITHAIELPVADTDSAFANFDDITYGKGGALLKQLMHLLGPEQFRAGVADYLRANTWGNTELVDFIDALSRAAGRDLDGWTKEWLYTTGVNEIAVETDCTDGRLTSLRLRQTAAPGSATPRTHRLQIATFAAGGNAPTSTTTATIAGPLLEVSPVPDVACPALVYPNHDDWAYFKVRLSDADFAFLRDGLRTLPDPLTRAMLWRNLWEAMRDARLPLTQFADIVLRSIGDETDPFTARRALEQAYRVAGFLRQFGAEFVGANRNYESALEDLAWGKLQSGALDADALRLWFDSFARVASSETAQDRLAGLLEGTQNVPGLELDQDRRWNAIANLSEFAHPSASGLAMQESARDPSSRGKQWLISLEAIAPDLDQKQRWLDRIINDREITLSDARIAMRWLLPESQPQLGRQLQARILDALPQLSATREQPFLEAYSESLIGGWCDAESKRRLEAALRTNRAASLTVTNAIKIALQDDQRCLAMKALETKVR